MSLRGISQGGKPSSGIAMFFLGKLNITVVLLGDLLLFLAILWATVRSRSHTGRPSRLCLLLVYFLQLAVLLIFVPLRPEGCTIQLSNYSASAVNVIPVVDGKALYSKQLKLKVEAGRKTLPSINLLRFKERPRDLLFDFGQKHDDFTVAEIEFFTTFLSYRLPVVRISGAATAEFFKPLHQAQDEDHAEAASKAHLRKVSHPRIFLFRQTDELSRHFVWQELLRRSVLWAMSCTLLLGMVSVLPAVVRLALRHAQRRERTLSSASAYYGFSALVICISLSGILLVAEFGVRFAFRDVLSTASGINYFYNHSYSRFASERNSQKFRGKDFHLDGSGKFRIVVIGDSITYGQGVYPYTLRYTDLTEKMLNAAFPDQPMEVINLGICGQDLPEHIRFLYYVKQLHPDFVLYQWFINDMDFSGPIGEMMAPRLVKNRHWHEWLIDHSAIYFLLQRGWQQVCLKNGRIKSYDQHIIDLFKNDNSPASNKAGTRLVQLLEGIKAIGKPCGVVLFPHAAFPIHNYPFAFMHERIARLCSDQKTPCLDLRATYASFDNQLPSLWANRFDPHPSALAHDLAAKSIVAFFGPTWRQLATEKQREKRD